MSRARRSSRGIFFVFLAVVVPFFLAQQFGRGTHLFADVLTQERITPFSSLAKLVPQLLGCIYAGLSARHYETGSTARRAWMLMSAWLGSWFLGQSVLATYANVLHRNAPVPSLGDLFFSIGCVCVVVALFTFASAYRASGFAVGSARAHTAVALGACAVLGPLAYLVLFPIAMAPTPIGERLVNVGYPLMDLAMLVPAMVLLRITVGFRGGQVWRVWATILLGAVFALGADLVLSDMTPAYMEAVGPLADLLFILGYAFCGYAMRMQYELVTD